MPIRKTRIRKKNKIRTKIKRLFDLKGDYIYVPPKLKKFCVPIKEISLLEKNPRINDKAAERLAVLIKENGFRKPIVIDQHGKVMAGNTAYKAARLLGMKFIPAAESDFYGEADSMRYVISDNKASEYSYWDTDLLKDLVKSKSLDDKKHVKGLGLSATDMRNLFDIKKEKQAKHVFEVITSVDSETEAETIFNELKDRGYSCRVIAS